MKEELVSVIITTYNSNELFLKEAIESVLSQTYKNLEIIVIDDGSINGVSKNVCYQYKNKIKYIFQENFGLASARNKGIKNSNGKYIAFLDDDDIWMEDKISEQIINIKHVEEFDTNVAMTFTFSEVIDERGKLQCKYGYKVKGNIYSKILGRNIIGAPSSVLIKKEVLDEVGYFNENFRYAEDIELWYRIARIYTIYSTDKYLIKYRYRKNSLSKNNNKMFYYTELALKCELNKNINDDKINLQKKEIYTRFYLNALYSSFSDNNIDLYMKLMKQIFKISILNVLKFKVIGGYIFSLFGKNFVQYINNKRRKTGIPKNMTFEHDYTD